MSKIKKLNIISRFNCSGDKWTESTLGVEIDLDNITWSEDNDCEISYFLLNGSCSFHDGLNADQRIAKLLKDEMVVIEDEEHDSFISYLSEDEMKVKIAEWYLKE